MNTRYIDWIWRVSGSLALAPGQSIDDAFDRLDPLFRQPGTSHDRTGDTLTFRKKDQASQDQMSIFDRGALQIESGDTGSVLRYWMTSRALLFCFLAPLLFLGFAQLTIVVGKYQKESTEAAVKEKGKKSAKKDTILPQNPIDKALGAPAPDKPKKDGKDKDDKKPAPTAAYVFAAIFATLYVAGRMLESRLVKKLFTRSLID